MNRILTQIKTKVTEFWKNRSKLQKILMISGIVTVVILSIVIGVFASSEKMVPLYKDLTAEETGQIKQVLDEKGIPSEIDTDGSVIKVPEEQVDSLKVDLAAEGLPKSGSIDYSFFGENAGFGMTDNEFDVLKVKATQTELSNLMKGMEGIKDSKVMINLPKDSVFIGEEKPQASASIVLQIKPGYTLDQSEVNGLYHLVSKSIPNLDEKNIVIMDQNSTYYDLTGKESGSYADSYSSQREVKAQIEKDLQRQIQQMLGTMMGQNKVVVSVTSDIDFTKENRTEDLVEPVDKENMEGITVSAERVNETYAGEGAQAGGVNGTGENDVTNYAEAGEGGGAGDYEKSEERINTEVNRIHKEIAESPYKIRDLGVQVMVEPPKANDPQSLPAERVDDIKKILSTIVKTSIDKNYSEEPLNDEEVEGKIVVSVSPFDGKQAIDEEAETGGIPLWVYITGGVVLVALAGLIIWLVKRRKTEDEEEDEWFEAPQEPIRVSDVNNEKETEESVRRKQLEKMAKDKPDEFAKLLRSWLTEE
ncbi:flagellar M-ring protein FliF [Bacillus sp. WMMC1349]|uniref:flagellar basal-body MS-ring/collar protein FliF n=1 Tax=Bacillus sp. WMMC1349 TaxID=2736254 RepID=UPI001551A13E|nr:flagellar basal-body MS-ring/collar protein FliF [Bacillus sp. WMMC1349]NPC92572.1 flagellar M-ring protein FliF [Bacillus sp. WMMC1349]